MQFVLRVALPVLPYREPEIFRSCGELKTVFEKEHIHHVLVVTGEGIIRSGIATHLEGIREDAIPVMAAHTEKEANPLYPVPRLMTRKELEGFYYQVCAEGASATI